MWRSSIWLRSITLTEAGVCFSGAAPQGPASLEFASSLALQGLLLLLLLLAQQGLMKPFGFPHFFPVLRKPRLLGAHLPVRKLFNARAVSTHAVFDFAHSLKPAVKALHGALLLLNLALPLGAGTRAREKAGLAGLCLLQA